MSERKQKEIELKAEVRSILTKTRRLRKYLRDFSSAEMEEIAANLELLILERQIEELEATERKAVHQKNIERVLELMSQHGVSEKDLLAASDTGKRTPKYLYIDENGEKHRWNGKGRTPKLFSELIENGFDIDKQCLARNIER